MQSCLKWLRMNAERAVLPGLAVMCCRVCQRPFTGLLVRLTLSAEDPDFEFEERRMAREEFQPQSKTTVSLAFREGVGREDLHSALEALLERIGELNGCAPCGLVRQ